MQFDLRFVGPPGETPHASGNQESPPKAACNGTGRGQGEVGQKEVGTKKYEGHGSIRHEDI